MGNSSLRVYIYYVVLGLGGLLLLACSGLLPASLLWACDKRELQRAGPFGGDGPFGGNGSFGGEGAGDEKVGTP